MHDGKFDMHHSSRKLKNIVRFLSERSDTYVENKWKISVLDSARTG